LGTAAATLRKGGRAVVENVLSREKSQKESLGRERNANYLEQTR